MIPEDLSQLGLASIVVLLLLREVFGFLKTHKANGNSHLAYDTSKTMSRLDNEISTLVAEIRKMGHAINNLNTLLTLQTHELKESRQEAKQIKEQLEKLREEVRTK